MLLPLLAGVIACASASPPKRFAFREAEIRDIIGQRIPGVPPGDIVVPFELPGNVLIRAGELSGSSRDPHERLRALADALTAESGLGLRYDPFESAPATETLVRGSGNCLALASVLVGLARSEGIPAVYISGKELMPSAEPKDELAVTVGHVGVALQTSGRTTAVDFGGVLKRYSSFRPIDDLEAAAHFYNNRGYDAYLANEPSSDAERWLLAHEQFERATNVSPGLAYAWNNLGVASARLGRSDSAILEFKRASEADPTLRSPRVNLGVLFLARGETASAAMVFAEAVAVEPDNALLHYYYGRALVETGAAKRAVAVLTESLALDPELTAASELIQCATAMRDYSATSSCSRWARSAGREKKGE